MGLDPQDLTDWDVALSAAQHHVNIMPGRERDPPIEDVVPVPVPTGVVGDPPARPIYNGVMAIKRKHIRKPKIDPNESPETKRARALDSMVTAAERSTVLQRGAAEAGVEHLRRLEVADAEVTLILAVVGCMIATCRV